MDKREIEELLYAYPYYEKELRKVKAEIERLEIAGIKAISYDFKPKSNSKTSVVENEVLYRQEAINRLEGKIAYIEGKIDKVNYSLSILKDIEREIIERYYFKRCLCKDIAQQLYITHIYVSRKKKDALEKLCSILK